MKYIRRFASKKTERELFDDLAKELSIKTFDDWYKHSPISDELLERKEFSFFKLKYGGNLAKAIQQTYPEHNWKLWKFKTPVPSDFWEDRQNRFMFLNELSKQLGIKYLDDWYRVDTLAIRKNGGSGLLKKYNNSLFELLKDVYPTHDWKIWDFPSVPGGFWADFKNHRIYFDHLAKKLNIKEWTDWVNIRYEDIWKNRGAGLINWYYDGSLMKALSKVYPEYNWKYLEGNVSKLKTQTRLFEFTKEFFPNADIHLNYWLKFTQRKTSQKLQLDIFIPSINLAIEYQGRQHYFMEKNDIFGDEDLLNKQIDRDKEKLELCKGEGITLIMIPFWWNGSKDSLSATIANARPDLVQLYNLGIGGIPIPEKPPSSFLY